MSEQEVAVSDKIIDGLLSTSDEELDNQLNPLIEQLRGLDKAGAKPILHEILDQAVHGALTSSFYIMFFDALWKSCGGCMEDVKAKHG